MEKLQPILSALKKHHFWIVCVIAIGVVLGGLFMALDELPPEFDKNKGAVQQLFVTAGQVRGKQLAGQTWPEEADKKRRELHVELTEAAKKLQVGQEIERPKKAPPEMLEKFQKNAPNEVDQLRKIIGGVQWDEAALKQFRGQFEFAAPPAAEVVFEGLEKLAVTRAVFSAMASTNDKAPDKYNLPISAIEVLEIGSTALSNRPARSVEGFGPPPGPPPAAGPAPPAAAPPKAPAKAPPPRKGAPGPAAPPPAPAVVAPIVTGLRPYPVRLRLKMNPDMFGRFAGALVNQRTMIVIDDVLIANEVRLRSVTPPRPQAPVGADGPPAAAGPAGAGGGPGGPRAPRAPGAVGAGVRPAADPMDPGAPAAPGGPGPGPGGEDPGAEPAAEKAPHLVQVPRGSVVEIQATAYFVDIGQLDALKTAATK